MDLVNVTEPAAPERAKRAEKVTEKPAPPVEVKRKQAVYWSRYARHQIGPIEFKPFFPDESHRGFVPDSRRDMHSDNSPQIFRGFLNTEKPEFIEELDKRISRGDPALLRMPDKEI